ncbi:MAG: amino acid adenylation domain-containing protein [Lachnospiraceae bacterium]
MVKNILEYLEESVKKHPGKIAFADEMNSCTYEQLEQQSRQIGSVLAKQISPGTPIPVFSQKSVSTVMAFMGAVYAGCFYVLLDPKQPSFRVEQILQTLEADVILVDRAYEKELNRISFSGQVLYVDDCMTVEEEPELLQIRRKQALDMDPLYVNFTSGSTGVPKGVVVSHRSVIDFMECFTELFHITEEDVIGNQAPFDFDVSVKDIYATLKTGATMQMIPKKLFSFPTKLLDFLCEREVTTLIWAVSALCIITTLKGFEYRVPEKIRKVIFSGEVMPIKHLHLWKTYLPEAAYVNVYGPTEITCNCTYYKVEREFAPEEVLPIGEPFPNEKVFLLDEQNALVTASEPEQKGEICVSGTALSLGYYNNPEQTKRAFVQNPLNHRYLETIYRTGDVGYYNQQGELCFTGRKDFQIKHMGHRIELGEIEAAMNGLEEIIRVCCLYDEEQNKIVAFYEGEIEKRPIIKAIGITLPAFMIPNVFIKVEAMPLNNNGKIDRKALKNQYVEG